MDRVDGGDHNLGVHAFEVPDLAVKRVDLGRAHEREVQGVEVQEQVLALVVGEADVLEGLCGA